MRGVRSLTSVHHGRGRGRDGDPADPAVRGGPRAYSGGWQAGSGAGCPRCAATAPHDQPGRSRRSGGQDVSDHRQGDEGPGRSRHRPGIDGPEAQWDFRV